MKVLGCDLGSDGAAVYYDGDTGEVLTWVWSLEGERPDKLDAFQCILIGIFMDVEPDAVFYERPFARGQAATRLLWGMAGVLEATSCKRAALLDETPSRIKKHATGNGNASKEEMIEAARALGYDAETEHAADAFHAALFALNHVEVQHV